jgi:hypothetical protein
VKPYERARRHGSRDGQQSATSRACLRRIDWLGRAYVQLQPLTNALYGMVETYLPADVRYKIRGAITDDLGQRSLFLLLLTAAVELTLYSLFKFLKYLVLGSRRRA